MRQKLQLGEGDGAATSCWTADVIHPTSHTYAKMALHLLEAMAPQSTAVPVHTGSSRGGGRGGDGNSRKRTHSDCESVTRNSGRQGERSRNWAEQRRDQARSDQHYYPAPYPAPYAAPYRGSPNPGNFYGRSNSGGDDRYSNYGGGGGRPYNRGRGPRGKRRH